MGILQIARNVILFPCHAWICYLLSDHKYGKKASLFIWTTGGLVFSILIAICGFLPDVITAYRYLYVLSVISYALIFILTSLGGIWKNTFLFITYALFFLLFNTILLGFTRAPMGESDLRFIIGRISSFGLAAYLLDKYLLPAFRRISSGIHKGFGMPALVSAMYLVLISGFGMRDSSPDGERFVFMETEMQYLGMNLLLLVIISISYLVIFRLIGSLEKERERHQAQISQKMLENELYAEKEYVLRSRQFWHDLRHHNRILMEYLNQDRVEEAKNYLTEYEDSMQTSMEDHGLQEFCAHPVVNALLCMTKRRCSHNGIRFSAKTMIPSLLPLSAPETSMLFGNLLENAWESCERCKRKEPDVAPRLLVYASASQNVLCVEVKNTVYEKVRFTDGIPRTTKEGGGTGSGSMERVLKKYKGMVQYQVTENLFVTRIILPLKDEGEDEG